MSFIDGEPIKCIPPSIANNSIYLSFDDGPSVECTERVLDLLGKENVTATFFCIVSQAVKNKRIIRRIQNEGHAIGNHSLDHSYAHFFGRRSGLTHWIHESENQLQSDLGVQSIGFRPPAGVVTPPLKHVLKDMGLPHILWSRRFYDTVFTWTRKKAVRSARQLTSGDIILLHDGNQRNINEFQRSLQVYISEIKKRGFHIQAIPSLKNID